MARNQKGLFVCESTKCQEWLLEDHDEQVDDQPYPRHVRWWKCLANVKAREAVIPVILRRWLARYLSHVAEFCPAEIWNAESSEEGELRRALKPF